MSPEPLSAPKFASEDSPLYNQEFNAGLKKAKEKHNWQNIKELRLGERLVAVVLFGSLSNKLPKMGNDSKLQSDADILLLYSGTKKKLYRAYKYGSNPDAGDSGQFAEHIPDADVVAMNMHTIMEFARISVWKIEKELSWLKEVLAPGSPTRSQYWLYQSDRAIVDAYIQRLAKDYTVLPQMILTGTVLEGALPESVRAAAQKVISVYGQVVSEMRAIRDALPE